MMRRAKGHGLLYSVFAPASHVFFCSQLLVPSFSASPRHGQVAMVALNIESIMWRIGWGSVKLLSAEPVHASSPKVSFSLSVGRLAAPLSSALQPQQTLASKAVLRHKHEFKFLVPKSHPASCSFPVQKLRVASSLTVSKQQKRRRVHVYRNHTTPLHAYYQDTAREKWPIWSDNGSRVWTTPAKFAGPIVSQVSLSHDRV